MNINEEHLRQVFSTYGELVSVKIPAGKKCAFVQFSNRFVLLNILVKYSVILHRKILNFFLWLGAGRVQRKPF